MTAKASHFTASRSSAASFEISHLPYTAVLLRNSADRRKVRSVGISTLRRDCMTKILLVDDSKFLRMATERALARAGYVVISASDGPQAIELAKKETPNVILLDMMLPGMAGPDVLKALKKDPDTKGIPVVAFTGLSQKNAERLQKDGACAFLEKSVLDLDKGSEALLEALAEILRRLKQDVPAGRAAYRAAGV